ncbi:MAG: hypothetical protein AVDCRST_MAG38-450, partial [uncultured Solirubrobacteraceae bacterium]
ATVRRPSHGRRADPSRRRRARGPRPRPRAGGGGDAHRSAGRRVREPAAGPDRAQDRQAHQLLPGPQWPGPAAGRRAPQPRRRPPLARHARARLPLPLVPQRHGGRDPRAPVQPGAQRRGEHRVHRRRPGPRGPPRGHHVDQLAGTPRGPARSELPPHRRRAARRHARGQPRQRLHRRLRLRPL